MRTVRISKFTQEEEHIEWLIEGLLPDVGWTLFVGRQGLGKTTFAMQLCSALQEGKPFLGRKTKKCNIMYIQADSPTNEWREMLKRIAPKSKGITVVDVPAKCLDNIVYVDNIKRAVELYNPDFLVFDSLYNLTGQNINNATQALIPLETMKTIANTNGSYKPWMLIHHPPQEQNRAAGAHSIGANCSNEWILLKTKLKIEKGRLVATKEIRLRRDESGLWEEKKGDDGTESAFTALGL